ncbi:MAG: alpha-amylase family glycosyl hydrolase [Halanaerobiales bacterium]|nr:alpha-amylase family glycosyl hydrolase [Halanaerobiales bacterium]
MKDKIKELWEKIYGNEDKYLNKVYDLIEQRKQESEYKVETRDWFKEGVVYSLYVDLFADDFNGLSKRLDYLSNLGVNTIWLLPILKSPMVDQGFDISDYYKIREELGTNQEFIDFLENAHQKDIKIVFDIAVNHTSDQHEWFENAKKSKSSRYRDFYIWNDNKKKYNNTRLLLEGVSNSNWSYNENTDDYYFHRFYDIQPDLNYKNPEVLFEMLKAFTFWKIKGVDGFRMDAAPFLWKKEGTNCENLKETHLILKIFRAVFDSISKGTVMIAEANQMPEDVIEYLGNGDECHVVYNFPIMPRIFLSLAENDVAHIKKQLDNIDKLKQPKNTAWFTFLRGHDELTLEFVSEKERKLMNQYYLKEQSWTFREGKGISGRLFDLMEGNVQKILLAYSILFSIQGTPIIYFGDEVGMENDIEFYEKMNQKFGYKDSRYLNRGPFDDSKYNEAKNNPDSKPAVIFKGLKDMVEFKNQHKKIFKRKPEYKTDNNLLISKRSIDGNVLTVVNNLSDQKKTYNNHSLDPYDYIWILQERSKK